LYNPLTPPSYRSEEPMMADDALNNSITVKQIVIHSNPTPNYLGIGPDNQWEFFFDIGQYKSNRGGFSFILPEVLDTIL
jgi:hypothetical protein